MEEMCNKHTFQAPMVRAAVLIHCLIKGLAAEFHIKMQLLALQKVTS